MECRLVAGALLLSLSPVAAPAHAGVVFVMDRASLGSDDFVDWGVLGPAGPVPNPFMITSNGGLAMTCSKPSAGFGFRRLDQNIGWAGNFAPGDHLIWTVTAGPMRIEFDDPVAGAGAQIQRNVLGPFEGSIEAFDVSDVSLGSFTLMGVSTFNADNSAIFLGVLSNTAEIKAITFDIDPPGGVDFAINQLDIVTGDSDGDGIPDDEDACPDSILTATIVIDGCDSGVENLLFEDGCTMADLIAECDEGAANHGQFVSCVARITIEWRNAGLINGQEMGSIESCAIASSFPAQAFIFVDDDAPPSGNGLTWETAYRFLQDALADAAASGGTITEIRVAQGTYLPDRDEANPNGTGDINASFQLVSSVAIRGGYAGVGGPDPDARHVALYETVLSGDLNGDDTDDFYENTEDNVEHVVTATATSAATMLDGLTIKRGFASSQEISGSGGGISLIQGSLQLFQCRLNRNSGRFGGGMLVDDGSAQLLECLVEDNHADASVLFFGAGIFLHLSQVDFEDCTFTANNARTHGGAVYSAASESDFVRCLFDGNTAGSAAGAIFLQGAAVFARDCTFIENHAAGEGGAIRADLDCDPVFLNCVFEGNSAFNVGGVASWNCTGNPLLVNCRFSNNSSQRAGAVFNRLESAPTYVNCTFVNNTAMTEGGAMWNVENTNVGAHNCILWGNTPDQMLTNFGGSISVSYSDVQGGFMGVGNIDADPLFVDPDNGDFRLSAGSPCIDAADNTAVPEDIETDLDGNPRFVDDPATPNTGNGTPPIVDMGAYEFQLPCPWDLNGDDVVSVPDLLLLLGDFGSCDGSPADFDGDGCVGVPDLLALIANFGPCPGSECVWDVNGDGVVDNDDLQQVLANQGPCDGCPEDVNGDGIVNGLDAAAVATHFGPCP